MHLKNTDVFNATFMCLSFFKVADHPDHSSTATTIGSSTKVNVQGPCDERSVRAVRGVFVSGSSVNSMSMADGGTGLGFAHVAVSAVSTEHAGLDFIQVVTPHAQLGLQQVDIRLIAAFLHRHRQKAVLNVC